MTIENVANIVNAIGNMQDLLYVKFLDEYAVQLAEAVFGNI